MKKFFFTVAFAFAMLIFHSNAQAQCNFELYSKSVAAKVAKDGYTFSKSYRIDGKGGGKRRTDYTCVLSKDTNYELYLQSKDGGAGGVIATLYDRNQNKLVTSYSQNTFYKKWVYKCRQTGVYYLSFVFHKSAKSYCASAVLGFKK